MTPVAACIRSNPFWEEDRELSRAEAWFDLVALAGEGCQFTASVRQLARRWRWGAKRVHTFLRHLADTGRLSVLATSQAGTTYRMESAENHRETQSRKHLSIHETRLTYNTFDTTDNTGGNTYGNTTGDTPEIMGGEKPLGQHDSPHGSRLFGLSGNTYGNSLAARKEKERKEAKERKRKEEEAFPPPIHPPPSPGELTLFGEAVEGQTEEGKPSRAQPAGKGDAAFEEFWKQYPKRGGSNPRAAAYRAWRARLREGVLVEEIMEGLERYRSYLESTGKVGTEYVSMASSFLGRNRLWEEPWDLPMAPKSRAEIEAEREAEEEYEELARMIANSNQWIAQRMAERDRDDPGWRDWYRREEWQ